MCSDMDVEEVDEVAVDKLDEEIFRRDYFRGDRPLAIRGGVKHWPAVGRWSRDYFESSFGSRKVPIDYSSDGFLTYTAEQGRNAKRDDISLSEAAVEIHDPDADRRCYLRNVSLPDLFPELLSDIEIPPLIGDPEKVAMNHFWYGAKGCTTSLHYDWPSNFLTQVVGRKKLLLFAPEQSPNVYPASDQAPGPEDTIDLREHSLVNPERPDLDRFPLLQRAKGFSVILHPGDMLWLPPEWWHQVTAMDVCVSVNFWWQPHIDQMVYSERHTQTLPVAYEHGFVQHFIDNALDNRDLDGTIGVAERCLELDRPWMACLLGGVALEDGLRQRCVEHNITEPDGPRSLRSQALNDKLWDASIEGVDRSTISAWTELIEASKGMDLSVPTPDEVTAMLREVRRWLAEHTSPQ